MTTEAYLIQIVGSYVLALAKLQAERDAFQAELIALKEKMKEKEK